MMTRTEWFDLLKHEYGFKDIPTRKQKHNIYYTDNNIDIYIDLTALIDPLNNEWTFEYQIEGLSDDNQLYITRDRKLWRDQ